MPGIFWVADFSGMTVASRNRTGQCEASSSKCDCTMRLLWGSTLLRCYPGMVVVSLGSRNLGEFVADFIESPVAEEYGSAVAVAVIASGGSGGGTGSVPAAEFSRAGRLARGLCCKSVRNWSVRRWIGAAALVWPVVAAVGCGNLPYLLPKLPEIWEAGEAARVSVNRIAYISPYGDLFTVNPDGTDSQRLTGVDRAQSGSTGSTGAYQAQALDFTNSYAWPAWSPDGTRLAVSRVRVNGNRSLEVAVLVIDAATGRSRMVYENDVPAMVADGAPHYLYWSPDGEYLSFLATTRQGLTLFVVNPDSADGAVALERGAPLYYSWSGDGASLIVHSREEIKLLRKPFSRESARWLADSVNFRTPALSPDGSRLAYAVTDGAGAALYVGETDNPDAPRKVLEMGSLTAFMWSPDGRELAVADNPDPRGRIFERVQVVAADGSSARTVAEEPLLAFYWAPNGERLAWVSVDVAEQVFAWKVVALSGSGSGSDADADAGSSGEAAGDIGGGAGSETGGNAPARELFRFRPSGEVFTMLSFFDQYAYSHSPWSPDSARLVVAGSPGPGPVEERRNGHTPTGSRVFVLDAVGDAPPQEIAESNAAFWSWN